MKKEIQRLDNVAGNYNPEKDFDNVLIKLGYNCITTDILKKIKIYKLPLIKLFYLDYSNNHISLDKFIIKKKLSIPKVITKSQLISSVKKSSIPKIIKPQLIRSIKRKPTIKRKPKSYIKRKSSPVKKTYYKNHS